MRILSYMLQATRTHTRTLGLKMMLWNYLTCHCQGVTPPTLHFQHWRQPLQYVRYEYHLDEIVPSALHIAVQWRVGLGGCHDSTLAMLIVAPHVHLTRG